MTVSALRSTPAPASPLDVLLVDPGPGGATALLADAGHRIQRVATRAEARVALAGRVFDVVIAEVQPDGLGVLADVRRLAPLTDVVLHAERGSVADAIAATRAGATYLEGAPGAPLLAALAGLARNRADEPRDPHALEQALRRALGIVAPPEPPVAPERGALEPLAAALARFEHDYLLRALEHAGGSRGGAARALGISRKSLWAKLKRFDARVAGALEPAADAADSADSAAADQVTT